MQGLTPKQEKAIAALLANPALKDAAIECKVNESTLWRWLQDAEFQKAYQEARTRSLESTLSALQAAGVEAVKALREVMNDKLAKGSERVSAAKAVLELGLRGRDVLETEQRLRDLEERLNAQQAPGRKIR